MVLQGVDSVYDLVWHTSPWGVVTYGEVCHQLEVEMSRYHFEEANIPALLAQFQYYEQESERLIAAELSWPAYEMMLHASHTFNLLDARQAVSVTERQHYILRIRRLATAVAKHYYQARETLGFPLLSADQRQEQPL
jgi:glycyl-tRNA synthetase alpha chain